MAISFVAAGAVSTGVNPTVAVPAGTQAGDLLLIVTTGTATPTTPSGWTSYSAQGASQFITVLWRTHTGSQSNVAVTLAGATSKAVMLAYRDVGRFDTISVYATAAASTTVTTNTLTTAANDEYVISLFAANGGSATTWTAPASTTTRVNSASTGALTGLLIVDELQSAAGTSTARTGTVSANRDLSCVSIAIRDGNNNKRYWVGGTASWDGTVGSKWATTSGGAGGAFVPTAADGVFFDGSSGVGTVTISSPPDFGSLDCTGYTGTITGGNFTVRGNFKLSAGMTWTVSGRITFNGNSAAGSYDITTAGKTLTNNTGTNFSLSTGTWNLQDTLTLAGNAGGLTISTSFNTNNNAMNLSSDFNPAAAAGSTINLGSSTITLSGNNVLRVTNTGHTLNAGTSTIVITNTVDPASFIGFAGGGKTFYNVHITSTVIKTFYFTGANTFNDLSITNRTSAGMATLFFSNNQTVNGTLTLSAGTNATCRTSIWSDVIGTTRTLSVASFSAGSADYDFRDITISGVSSPISGTRFGDCGGNSGITFPSPKTVYWNLAGTQNWSATGWAATSGGSPSVNDFPLAQDSVVFDDAGSAGTVSIQAFNIGAVDMSARTSAMTLSSSASATIYGNMTFGSGVSVTGSSIQTFSGRGTMDYTSAGKTTTFPIILDTPSGTFRLIDAFNCSSVITHTRGTFNANNQNLTCTTFASNNSNTRTITMGSGTWTLSGTGTVWNTGTTTNLTFNKDTANIVLSNTTTNARTFTGGSLTYNKLTIGGATGTSTLTIQGSNTFSEIDSTKTVAHTVAFTPGTTNTVTTWSVKGTSGNVVTLNSSGAGSSYTLAKAGGGFLTGIDYLNVRDAIGSPISDTWYIGANSIINTTAPNSGYAMFTTQRANNAIVVLTSTSSTTWAVPSDWNNASNSINLIGGGGGGGGSRRGASGLERAGGGGGGGGGFTQLTNQTLSGSITYQAGANGAAGAAGADGTAGGTTSWDSGAATAGGGGGGQATTTPTSTGGTGGTGSTNNGGTGGAGSTSTVSNVNNSGGGGGGAGGPNGVGKNGGNGITSGAGGAGGGGGGGNGGGTNGGNGSLSAGGTGGNNSAGVGGGASNTSGAVGGGGGGTVSATSVGGNGIEFFGIGSGGGAGGGNFQPRTSNIGGFYGGGGGGAGSDGNGTTWTASPGRQGAIIIVYTPSAGVIVTGSSAISSSATVSSAGFLIASGSSAISASNATVSANGFVIFGGQCSIFGNASAQASATRILIGASDVLGNATATSSGGITAFAQSSVIGQAIASATGNQIVVSSASVVGNATALASGSKVFFADSAIFANATLSSAGLVERIGFAEINGIATATATARYTASASINVQCDATVIPSANAIFSAESSLACFATLMPNGRIIGDEWIKVDAEVNTWNDANVGTNEWTAVATQENNWTDVNAGNNSWVEVQPGDNTWLRQG